MSVPMKPSLHSDLFFIFTFPLVEGRNQVSFSQAGIVSSLIAYSNTSNDLAVFLPSSSLETLLSIVIGRGHRNSWSDYRVIESKIAPTSVW